jgi:hypothetical protein
MNPLAGARRLRRFNIQHGKAFDHGSGVNAALRFMGPKRELPVGGILSPRERVRARGKGTFEPPTCGSAACGGTTAPLRSDGSFPLTPALSLRERGNRLHVVGQ